MSLSDSSSERSFNSEDSEANLAEVEDEQSDRESQVHVKAWKMTLHMPIHPWLMKNS